MICEILTHARKEIGMTRVSLGKKIGVSSQFIAHWEWGNSNPPLKYVRKLCKHLNIDLEYFKSVLVSEYRERLNKEI